LFDLCLQLGYPHPDYLLGQLTCRQLQEWLHYLENRDKMPVMSGDEIFEQLRRMM